MDVETSPQQTLQEDPTSQRIIEPYRLYEKGWIDDPRNKAKSIVFTEEGLALSKQLFEQYFKT